MGLLKITWGHLKLLEKWDYLQYLVFLKITWDYLGLFCNYLGITCDSDTHLGTILVLVTLYTPWATDVAPKKNYIRTHIRLWAI